MAGSSIHSSLRRAELEVSVTTEAGNGGSDGRAVALEVNCRLSATGISVATG